MGCTNCVSIDNFKFLPEDNQDYSDLSHEYNSFCALAKKIAEELETISGRLGDSIKEFFSNIPNNEDFGKAILEGYIQYILTVVHYLYKIKRVKEPLSFSNYLPGIIIDTSSLGETSDGNEEVIRRKFEALSEISRLLPRFIDDFERLSEKMIDMVIRLRDEYPRRFYERSLELPGISCVIPFSQIEMVLIHNIEVISLPAIGFEKIFNQIRVLIKNLSEIIENCHERFSDFKKLLDGIDSWDYSLPNSQITQRVNRFIGTLKFHSDSIH